MRCNRSWRLPGLVLILCAAAAGCDERTGTAKEMQTSSREFMREVVIPLAQKGMSRGVSGMQFQGGAHANNPKYVLRVKGYLVSGFEGEASIGLDGVAGQMMMSARGTDAPPPSPSDVPTIPSEEAPTTTSAEGVAVEDVVPP